MGIPGVLTRIPSSARSAEFERLVRGVAGTERVLVRVEPSEDPNAGGEDLRGVSGLGGSRGVPETEPAPPGLLTSAPIAPMLWEVLRRSIRWPPMSEGRGGPENWGHSEVLRPPLSSVLLAKDRDWVCARGAKSRAEDETDSYKRARLHGVQALAWIRQTLRV